MAEIEAKPLVDFRKHLQELLDIVAQDTFVVSSVRNMNTDKNKINVVVTALAGRIFENSATIPYTVEVISNNPDEIINIFSQVAKAQNNKSFIEVVEEESGVKEYTVFEFYSTPSIAEKDVDYDNNHKCRLLMYVDLNVLFEVGNVSKVEIDNEVVEFSTGNLSYGIESFSMRQPNAELNRSKKRTATTSLQLTMVNKTSVFTNKLFQIMFGTLNGNTKFSCKITLTNGITGTLPMILNNNSFNFAKNSPNLPSLNVVLSLTKD